MPNSTLSFSALIIIVVGVIAFVVLKYPENTLLADEKLASPSIGIDLSYAGFLKDIEKECPYYEPSGAAYRDCLVDLLTKRDKEVSGYLGRFVMDLQADTSTEFLTARQTFVTDLGKFSDTWLTYRDQLCTVQADAYWGGSDQGGELNRCRLYETERFYRLLQNLRSEWVSVIE